MIVESFVSEFRRYRELSEGAAAQVVWDQLRVALDPETNSIAVIMKHVGGNLRSRWTEPFTSDGEKAWRQRDTEFIDDFADREALMSAWNVGWSVLEGVLAACSDADLDRVLMIRGEAHTFARALVRSSSHCAYHAGQIVQTARALASRAGVQWMTLTVPRGGSDAHNQGMGFNPGRG